MRLISYINRINKISRFYSCTYIKLSAIRLLHSKQFKSRRHIRSIALYLRFLLCAQQYAVNGLYNRILCADKIRIFCPIQILKTDSESAKNSASNCVFKIVEIKNLYHSCWCCQNDSSQYFIPVRSFSQYFIPVLLVLMMVPLIHIIIKFKCIFTECFTNFQNFKKTFQFFKNTSNF